MKIVGVDAGSTMLKFAVFDENNIESLKSYRIAGDPICATNNMLNELKSNDFYFGVTGSSRKLVGDYLGAMIIKPEIIAHLRGVKLPHEGKSLVFEIGGQDSKLLVIENGKIQNFKMNSNCAAGTGSFIEAQSRRFNMSVEEFDMLAISSFEKSREINTKCATFLESALINLQRQGVSKDVIALTVFHSLARNYVDTMCNDICIDEYENIYFVGGVAKIKYMKKIFEKMLNKNIIVPENCEYTGAMGMGKILRTFLKNAKKEIHKVEKIQCEDCDNRCVLKKVVANEYIKYEGCLCGKYDKFV